MLCLGTRFAEWHRVRFIKWSIIYGQYSIKAMFKVNRNQEGDIERCSSQFRTVWRWRFFDISRHESVILALSAKFQYSLVPKGHGGCQVFIWSRSVVCMFSTCKYHERLKGYFWAKKVGTTIICWCRMFVCIYLIFSKCVPCSLVVFQRMSSYDMHNSLKEKKRKVIKYCSANGCHGIHKQM